MVRRSVIWSGCHIRPHILATALPHTAAATLAWVGSPYSLPFVLNIIVSPMFLRALSLLGVEVFPSVLDLPAAAPPRKARVGDTSAFVWVPPAEFFLPALHDWQTVLLTTTKRKRPKRTFHTMLQSCPQVSDLPAIRAAMEPELFPFRYSMCAPISLSVKVGGCTNVSAEFGVLTEASRPCVGMTKNARSMTSATRSGMDIGLRVDGLLLLLAMREAVVDLSGGTSSILELI